MDYSAIPDTELAVTAQGGDDAAFQELMRRNIRPIWAFSRQYAKSDEDAEDIVQDTFFKAWKYLKRFTAGKAFRPWLYAIARNTALDYLKKRRSSSFSELHNDDTDSDFADSLEDAEPLAPEMFEKAELVAELDKSMEGLPPDYKAVLRMHYHDGMTFNEISEILGKPMNTVKSWHRRALQKVRKNLPHRKPD
ncbi:MAG: polymerase sigma factor, sigma-70 family [Candidatus Parcubacteria bacterium]|nr:polymerase sigma factor, sigma-70 family [Candidatus Parcubacteria bacterium]